MLPCKMEIRIQRLYTIQIEHHQNESRGNKKYLFRTQLCLAMADLILLMPEWGNAVQVQYGT
jgi:hypothetical protein